MSTKKLPTVFIGCSTESHRAAQAVQLNLSRAALCKIWSQNAFHLSQTTIEDLLKIAPTYDFAVFILAGEDMTKKRGVERLAPRDNVIFEAGLFMGAIGRERVFLVRRKDVPVDLPTDLAGVTTANYEKPPTKREDLWEGALGGASTLIEDSIRRVPFRSSAKLAAKRSEAQLKTAAQYFDKLLIQRYGVSTMENVVRLEITDLSGSATFQRRMRGIQVTKKGGIKIDKISGLLASSTPGSRIIKYPTLTEKPKSPKTVSIKHKQKKRNLDDFDIVIHGSLTQFDKPLSFAYESAVTKFCLMTREEVERAYRGKDFRYEYVSLRMEMPTRKAVIEVAFPDGYAAQVSDLNPAVFFGESEAIHDSELYRVRRSFKRTKRGARFTVSKPLIGFTYLIAWSPPARKDFDNLRRKK
jgi:hypothetical protein